LNARSPTLNGAVGSIDTPKIKILNTIKFPKLNYKNTSFFNEVYKKLTEK